ncbi:MAG TPA: FlgD immunoglobulin-like domain containing protein [bacterium]|nr:FlgD immunoglobulin-like domain containing protein [bacterium]
MSGLRHFRLLTLTGALALGAASSAPAAPTLSSNADQYFFVGGSSQFMIAATVADDATTPQITAANDIRIRIPAGFNMTWDPADDTAAILGSASAKVSNTVSFEDADQTLVLDVTTDFAAGESIIITGLLFHSFTATSPFDSLELEIGNDDIVTAEDDKRITVINENANRSSAIQLTPDGSEVWVVNPDHGTVSVIDTGSNTLQAEIPVGAEPWCVALHPFEPEAWVTSLANHRVYIVDTLTRAVTDSLDAGYETFGVAFNPQGTIALVTSSGSAEIFVFDTETRALLAQLPVYLRPRGICWRGDGARAWVSHLLMPEFQGRLTTVFASTLTTAPSAINQVFGLNLAGYPSTMQNIALAPAPGDTLLWIPNNMIHTSNGQLFGNPMTATNMFHASIRPWNTNFSSDLSTSTYFLSESGTDVGGPIAVAFKGTKAFVANLHSDDVTVLTNDILTATELATIPVGSGPIGIMESPSTNRVYVANWLSRDVTVIATGTNSVITTVPVTGSEPLGPDILNGKRLFFTSTGSMSGNNRSSCASCHVFGTHDTRPWDLSQYGKHLRRTPDIRGIGWTGAHDWTGDKDEMADHDFGIHEFQFGAGLIPGGGNPPLGTPNKGLSQDMDNIGAWMATLKPRPGSPFRNPDGTQTASADSGEVLFNDPTVGCATCHVPPFFTDSRLQTPFIRHDVGTGDPGDPDAVSGFDTPSLIRAWDHAPYLHSANVSAMTLQSVMTTFNSGDLHGTTSQLSAAQIDLIADYIKQLQWPDSTGTPVDAPAVGPRTGSGMEAAFPNPFEEATSLRFSLESNVRRVLVEVYDVQGRRVRTLLDGPMTRGTHVVGWDSRDESGVRVAAGVYFARYSVDGRERAGRKMTVLH